MKLISKLGFIYFIRLSIVFGNTVDSEANAKIDQNSKINSVVSKNTSELNFHKPADTQIIEICKNKFKSKNINNEELQKCIKNLKGI